jgi:hypothetical protein
MDKTVTENVRENTQTAEFRSAAHRQAVTPDSNVQKNEAFISNSAIVEMPPDKSAQIDNLEREEVQAILSNDVGKLDSLWTDDVSSSENLIFTKAQVFALFNGFLRIRGRR